MKNYTKTKIDRAWFSRLLRHPARKRSGSILTTQEPARGECSYEYYLEEVEERDVVDGVTEVGRVIEEEHASQSRVDDVRVTSRQAHEVQSLLATVTTSPERQRRLVLPRRSSVRLD